MWTVATRQLTRCNRQLELGKRLKQGWQEPGLWWTRSRSSVAAFVQGTQASKVEFGEVWKIHDLATALPFGPSIALRTTGQNPLEESVTALDAALQSAVHMPLLANYMWWMQWLSESRAEGRDPLNFRTGAQSAYRNYIGAKGISSAAALEVVEEEDAPNDEEVRKEQVKKIERVKKNDQKRPSKLYARQMKIESEAWKDAAAEYRALLLEMCKKNLAPNLPFVQSLLLGWFEPFKKAIEIEQKAVADLVFKEHRAAYGPYIAQLPADMLAVITMHKLMGLLMSDLATGCCVKVVSAASQIGEAVEAEVGIYKLLRKRVKKKKGKNAEAEITTIGPEPDPSVGTLQNKVKKLLKKQHLRMARSLIRHANGDEPWNNEIRVKVGCSLINLLLEVAYLQSPASQTGEDHGELRPAFKHSMKMFPGQGSAVRQFGVIECDPLIVDQFDKSVRYMVMPYMPMLVRPLNWRGFSKGGHLVLPTTVMRIHGSHHQRQAIEKAVPMSMNHVLEALDTLGSIRWKINTRVLDVIEKIWEDGGKLAEMVDTEDVPIPKKPDTDDELEIKQWKWQVVKAKRTNSERHSLRCDTELKLNVARKLQDEAAFYYPHNLDFRGRAYPLHPHLNHLGSDMCRGMLEFAEGVELGPTGLRWLKIHLANVFAGGVDKLAFDDRAAFVDQNLEDIFDSAEKPLDGRRWWLKAEDPFQCLATCMTIRDALLSDNVQTFVSSLPVHQDGSCNGLQHYAALGRDQVGAEAVNLIAGEKPADVYTGIAIRVRAAIEKDAGDDPTTNPNVDKAKLLCDQIDRKLVKQTVMTSVYGVTFIGARNQIMSRLKERGLGDEASIFRAACYAAKITIDALGQMFKEARCIMNWLGDCAKIIAAEGEPVKWVTPMGLPVVQPYRKPGRKMVKTSLQILALRVDGNQPVAVSRQRSAFPPNFVHSLDGSHMMMTALSCKRENIYFAGVHDSFWTHAGSVETLNCVLRRTFVELYSEPILENLLNNFKKQFPKLEFPDVPKRGDLDLSEVLRAPYFFN